MRSVVLALILALAAGGVARANCADEFNELQARVEGAKQRQPTPQTLAASKELQKAGVDMKQMDEVDCYNAVTRARRLLAAPPPPPLVKAVK
jgi:hypothetical protein